MIFAITCPDCSTDIKIDNLRICGKASFKEMERAIRDFAIHIHKSKGNCTKEVK